MRGEAAARREIVFILVSWRFILADCQCQQAMEEVMSNGDARSPHDVYAKDVYAKDVYAKDVHANDVSGANVAPPSSGSSKQRQPLKDALEEFGAAREVARQQLKHLSERAKGGQKELGTNLN